MERIYDMKIRNNTVKVVFDKCCNPYEVEDEVLLYGRLHYKLKGIEEEKLAENFIEFPKVIYLGEDLKLKRCFKYIVESEITKENSTLYTLKGIIGEFNAVEFSSFFYENETIEKSINLIISEKELIFRKDIISLYTSVYNEKKDDEMANPIEIIYLDIEELKEYILNAGNKMDIVKLAIENNITNIIEFFTNEEVILEFKENDVNSVWNLLIANNHLDFVKKLFNINIKIPDNLLIKYCSNCEDIKLITLKYLVEELGQSPNQFFGSNTKRETCVSKLSRKLMYEEVKYLHIKGARINAEYGEDNCIEKCLEYLEDVNNDEEKLKIGNKLISYLYKNGCPFVYKGNIVLNYE